MAVETSSDKDNGNGSNRYRYSGADFSYFFLRSLFYVVWSLHCFDGKAKVIELFNITRVQTKELFTCRRLIIIINKRYHNLYQHFKDKNCSLNFVLSGNICEVTLIFMQC